MCHGYIRAEHFEFEADGRLIAHANELIMNCEMDFVHSMCVACAPSSPSYLSSTENFIDHILYPAGAFFTPANPYHISDACNCMHDCGEKYANYVRNNVTC